MSHGAASTGLGRRNSSFNLGSPHCQQDNGFRPSGSFGSGGFGSLGTELACQRFSSGDSLFASLEENKLFMWWIQRWLLVTSVFLKCALPAAHSGLTVTSLQRTTEVAMERGADTRHRQALTVTDSWEGVCRSLAPALWGLQGDSADWLVLSHFHFHFHFHSHFNFHFQFSLLLSVLVSLSCLCSYMS